MLVMVNADPPLPRSRLAPPVPGVLQVVCMGKAVRVDDDPRYWWVAVDQGTDRITMRRIAVLDILGVPAAGLIAKNLNP